MEDFAFANLFFNAINLINTNDISEQQKLSSLPILLAFPTCRTWPRMERIFRKPFAIEPRSVA
jgi:hypothetical protein